MADLRWRTCEIVDAFRAVVFGAINAAGAEETPHTRNVYIPLTPAERLFPLACPECEFEVLQ